MIHLRLGRAVLMVATVLMFGALAACGSSSPSGNATTNAAATGATSASAGDTSADAASIDSTHGSAGTYLTDGDGHALYLWVADQDGTSTCSDSCASAWPPLTTSGQATASGEADSDKIGTVSRSDGAIQVTYDGHPLYYFAGDTNLGDTHGQGSDGFGAKWWLVAPSGSAITASGDGGGYSY